MIYRLFLLFRNLETCHSELKTPLAHFSQRRALISAHWPVVTLQLDLYAGQFPDVYKSNAWLCPHFLELILTSGRAASIV